MHSVNDVKHCLSGTEVVHKKGTKCFRRRLRSELRWWLLPSYTEVLISQPKSSFQGLYLTARSQSLWALLWVDCPVKKTVQPLQRDKPLVWLLPSLPSPWCKEIRSCSQGYAVCFEDYKTIENIVGKFWCCKCVRRLAGDVQPRDPAEVVSRVGYHFLFLKEGLQEKVSGPRPICHFVAPASLLLQSWTHCLESQLRLSDSVVWSGDLGLWASNFSFCGCFKKTLVWTDLLFPKDVP